MRLTIRFNKGDRAPQSRVVVEFVWVPDENTLGRHHFCEWERLYPVERRDFGSRQDGVPDTLGHNSQHRAVFRVAHLILQFRVKKQ